jgi:transposase-like protein
MTRPYSEDLRERAFARIEGGETIGSIAQALGISPSCVSKWRRFTTRGLAAELAAGREDPSPRRLGVSARRGPAQQALKRGAQR